MTRRGVARSAGWLAAAWLGMAGLWLGLSASPIAACSPVFEPTIEKLGPQQVVLVGTTGEKVEGGRLFHVERWYNASGAQTVTIAFKEGEPVGDCSYPVRPGLHLIIAPFVDEAGGYSADLGTLQADPATETGQAYIAEAERLFGAGTAPVIDPSLPGPPDASPPPLLIAGVLALAALGAWVAARRRPGTAERVLEQATLRAERDRGRTAVQEPLDRMRDFFPD